MLVRRIDCFVQACRSLEQKKVRLKLTDRRSKPLSIITCMLTPVDMTLVVVLPACYFFNNLSLLRARQSTCWKQGLFHSFDLSTDHSWPRI